MSAARLRLLQLVSPALPVGAFSYSEGLEVLVQHGRLADGPAVAAWLEAELEGGLLPVEAAALAPLRLGLERWRQGHSDGEAVVRELDGWLLAQREVPEVRAQQRQMGGSLLQLLADLGWPLPAPAALGWPSAWAWAGLALELEAAEVREAYLYAWCSNQISAAVRLVPLGPTEAQRLQLALAPTLALHAARLEGQDPRDLRSAGVGAALAQLGHGELYSRLFRS
jgi:urease accessory protein